MSANSVIAHSGVGFRVVSSIMYSSSLSRGSIHSVALFISWNEFFSNLTVNFFSEFRFFEKISSTQEQHLFFFRSCDKAAVPLLLSVAKLMLNVVLVDSLVIPVKRSDFLFGEVKLGFVALAREFVFLHVISVLGVSGERDVRTQRAPNSKQSLPSLPEVVVNLNWLFLQTHEVSIIHGGASILERHP